jgi:hypothetical protein
VRGEAEGEAEELWAHVQMAHQVGGNAWALEPAEGG